MTAEEADFDATLVALADVVRGRCKGKGVDPIAIAYVLAQILALMAAAPAEAAAGRWLFTLDPKSPGERDTAGSFRADRYRK